jgi:hypothetical protein
MKTFITCFLIYLCLAGCTPQRRLNRLVARHPELAAVDTVRFRKIYPLPAKKALMPIPVERFHREISEKHFVAVTDSATGITVGIADNANGDTLFIHVAVPEDSLQVDEPVPVKTVKVTQQSIGKTILENLPVMMLIVIVFVLVVFGRRK